MHNSIESLLNREKVGVISVIMSDSMPHAATIHFSHTSDPFKIYMFTSNATLKASPFLNGESGKAAMVVGFSLKDWETLQMHGVIKGITDSAELERIYPVHYSKHPETEKYKGPNTFVLEFTPTWWRYTDFKSGPPTIITS